MREIHRKIQAHVGLEPTSAGCGAASVQLKPYPEHKDSGLPWLGQIPAHWKVQRSKYLLREINARSPEGNEQLLSVSQYTGVTPRRTREGEDIDLTRAESLVGYKQVAPDDLVINIMLAWNGSLGIAPFAGIVSPAYCVYHFRSGAHPRYYHHLLRTPLYRGRIRVASTGVVESRLRLYSDDLFRIESLVPTKDEQLAIARFIEVYNRRTDRFIRAKRRLIQLLNEQKQAIIHRAVTRGLDPSVRLKPSGIGWLGDVPEHWEATRLKYVAKVQTGLTIGKTYGSAMLETRPYLRVANVQDGYLDLKDIATVHVPASEAVTCELQTGDVLMTEGGDIDKLGRGYIWRGEIPDCLHQNHIFAVRANRERLLPEYLALLMTSTHGRSYFQFTAKKTTNLASTNSTTLKAFPLFLPDIEEQQSLLNYIAEESSGVDGAISKSRKEIDLIREYRTRLIADVVTGKLDVRGVELPALGEADAPEDWDEVTEVEGDEMTDTEEAAADADY